MMRRGIVQRRAQIVAQRSGQRRLIAGLHRHGVDQRREQAFAFGMQQVAQRLGFGGQALHFAFGGVERGACDIFRGLGVAKRVAGGVGADAHRLARLARGLCHRFGGMDVGRVAHRFQGAVQPHLRIDQLSGGGFRQRRGQVAAAGITGLAHVPFRQFGGGAFQHRFRIAESGAEFGIVRGGGLSFGPGPRGGLVQPRFFRRQCADGRFGVLVQRGLAGDVALALGKQLAQALRRLAGARFLRLQLFALGDQAVMGGGALGLGLAQGRQHGGGVALLRGRPGGDVSGDGDGGGGALKFLGGGGGAGLGGDPAQIMRQCFRFPDMAGEVAITRGLAGLALEAGKLAFHFGDDVVETGKVGLRRLQPQFGFVPALMQAADAGGFLQDGAPRQRLLADQKTDLALADKGSRAGAGGSVGEENLHVALAHVAAIDAIDAAGLALDAAGDLDRLIVIEGRAGGAVAIVDEDGDFGDVAGGAAGATRKDHIVHLAAAHRGGAGLAHHPAHGVEQVGLAAAIRPDHGGEAGLDEELRRLDEGLETGKA